MLENVMDAINGIVDDRSIPPREKQERINKLLLEQGDQGIAAAVDAIAGAPSEATAAYAANFLAGVPGAVAEKNRAIREVVEQHPERVVAIANLVEFADDETRGRLTELVTRGPQAPGALSIAYELAQHFPDHMRAYRKELAPYDVFELLLPGAPDEWVEELVTKYRRDGDGLWAVLLSYVRTDAARDALVTLLKGAPSGRQGFLAALLESAGVFADSREASTYHETYRGFCVAPGDSPNAVDGEHDGPVPVTAAGKQPAERVLELARRALPFAVGGNYDPVYFWHEGAQAPGHVYVQGTKDGLKGIMTPLGKPAGTHTLVSAAASVELVKERHPFGFGGAAVAGSGRIQVGGYPQWRSPERFPRCPGCSCGMRFLASVDSGITPRVRFAFAGILYGFWCERCDVSCTYRQL